MPWSSNFFIKAIVRYYLKVLCLSLWVKTDLIATDFPLHTNLKRILLRNVFQELLFCLESCDHCNVKPPHTNLKSIVDRKILSSAVCLFRKLWWLQCETPHTNLKIILSQDVWKYRFPRAIGLFRKGLVTVVIVTSKSKKMVSRSAGLASPSLGGHWWNHTTRDWLLTLAQCVWLFVVVPWEGICTCNAQTWTI